MRPLPGKHTSGVRSRSRLRPVVLTGDEQTRLVRWVQRRRTARALALRARIVLNCSRGRSNREVARRLAVTVQTVGKWRTRFLELRADGLLDQPRSGAPRSISDELVEAVLARTLHGRAPDGRRWSSRRLADELGISQRAVLRIWRAFEV
jgi:transposase